MKVYDFIAARSPEPLKVCIYSACLEIRNDGFLLLTQGVTNQVVFTWCDVIFTRPTHPSTPTPTPLVANVDDHELGT